MKSFPETDRNDVLFALFGLSFVVFGWFALSLTLGSLFLEPLVIAGTAAIGIIAFLIAFTFIRRAPIDIRIALGIACFFALLSGYFSEPTIFSGRDQGSIAEAAYRLAENKQLAFSTPVSKIFFDIYGPGTALNFPGFAYTDQGDLITQFPLAYTSWLASFVTLFGITGLTISNTLLLFLFFAFLYALFRLFAHPYYAFSGLLLACTSFLPGWFTKETLTENLSVFLFVFLIYNLILYFRKGKFVFYVATLLTGGLLAFTRLEGFAFLGITLGIILFSSHTRIIWKTYPLKSILLPGIVFFFFLLRDLFLNLPYYKMAGKGLLGFAGDTTKNTLIASNGSLPIGSTLFIYGLLILFIIGLFGILIFIKKKQFAFLIPSLIALPTFLYLFSPNITPDHPWMLRRYLFSIFPTLLFSAVLGIALLFDKTKTLPISQPQGKRLFFASIILVSLFFFELPATLHSFSFAENRGLKKQTETFSQEFSERDLILIDRFATGSGFSMISGPLQFLFHKNAAYFFNPEDLERLDTHNFERIFLLVPETEMSRYTSTFGDRLVLKKQFSFRLEQFETLSLRKDIPRLPAKSITETHNLLFQIY